MTRGLLSGVKVLDLATQIAGPACCMMLGELGADVIKVEHPSTGDGTRLQGPPFVLGESALFLSSNRNKRSVALDVGAAAQRPTVVKLLKWADVVVQNFRPDVARKFGLDYPSVSAVNSGTVYLSVSAFGEEGPYRMRAGTDTVFQSMGGIMTVSGLEGDPPVKVGVAIADQAAALYGAFAIVSALFDRQRTGAGCKLEIALLEALMALQNPRMQEFLVTGANPERMGYLSPFGTPISTFRTKDGWISVSCITDKFWRNLCSAIGKEALAVDPRFLTNETRFANRHVLLPILEELFPNKTTSEWRICLDAADVPNGPVNRYNEVFDDPQVRASGIRTAIDHPKIGQLDVLGLPIRVSGKRPTPGRPPPLKGEHSEAIIREVAVSDLPDRRGDGREPSVGA